VVTTDAVAATRALEAPPGPTPCLVLDLAVVRQRYAELRAELPEARVYYAVKANPDPAVLSTLAAAGSRFDVASPGELELLRRLGVHGRRMCYANPIRKPTEVAAAWAAGVPRYVTDSLEDLVVLAEHAPGARVLVRVAVDESGSATRFGGKFGCSPDEAARLLNRAGELGLDAAGLCFHVGSQQTRPDAWADAVAIAGEVAASVTAAGGPVAAGPVRLLDLGGGFPVRYDSDVPPLADYAAAIRAAVRRHFPGRAPELAVQPGRLLVAEAGVLHAEVVRVSRRHDGRRWVYLDVGRYGGLAETEGEAIRYHLVTPHDDGPAAPAVLAGPTCDGDDLLYRDVALPEALSAGDLVRLLAAGAYTASYASVGFNGVPPLPVHCVDSGADPDSGDLLDP
jgi:ornithine decarboxylase